MINPWKRGFTPAHRRPKDRLRGAQLAPAQIVTPVVCAECQHPRLIHGLQGCLRVGCDCGSYVEEI